MSEEATQQYQEVLLRMLEQRGQMAEDFKLLEEMQVFKELILEGYLGRLTPLKDQLLDAIARDEDITELKREYQERIRFQQYVDFLRDGKKSKYWQEMYAKSNANGLTDEDIDNIRRSQT